MATKPAFATAPLSSVLVGYRTARSSLAASAMGRSDNSTRLHPCADRISDTGLRGRIVAARCLRTRAALKVRLPVRCAVRHRQRMATYWSNCEYCSHANERPLHAPRALAPIPTRGIIYFFSVAVFRAGPKIFPHNARGLLAAGAQHVRYQNKHSRCDCRYPRGSANIAQAAKPSARVREMLFATAVGKRGKWFGMRLRDRRDR
jgi:hypothetical protein